MTTDGGGWTGLRSSDAHGSLGGALVAVDSAAVAAVDPFRGPYTRDGRDSHTYHYSFDVPGGSATEFYLADYAARANATGSHVSEISIATPMTSWARAWNPHYGDIGFGSASATGPVISFANVLTGNAQCRECEVPWPADRTVYPLPDGTTSFRIGWGEYGSQSEGWYPWWTGRIFIR